jgi:L-histidine Nalpha-methyltransferase
MWVIMKGFESKADEVEFWSALKSGSSPLKYVYIGDSAYNYDQLTQLETYHRVSGVTEVEIEPLIHYYDKNEPISELCDIGPGNGLRSGAFLDALNNEGYPIERYLALDFSKRLLERDAGYIRSMFPRIEVSSDAWDFERGPTRAISEWRKHNKLLIMLMGQTLGNPEDPQQVLRNHFLSALPGDAFLVGVALISGRERDQFLDDYRNDIFEALILGPLKMAGIDVACGELELSFSEAQKAVIGEFVFGETLDIIHNNETISFNRGDRIHCFKSRRFEASDVNHLLRESGWRTMEVAYDEDKAHAVFLCERAD